MVKNKSFYSVPRIVTFFGMMLSAAAIKVLKLRSSYILIAVWTIPIKYRKKRTQIFINGGQWELLGVVIDVTCIHIESTRQISCNQNSGI